MAYPASRKATTAGAGANSRSAFTRWTTLSPVAAVARAKSRTYNCCALTAIRSMDRPQEYLVARLRELGNCGIIGMCGPQETVEQT